MAAAEEEQRWDHRGALGLIAGGGVDFVGQVKSGGEKQEGTFPLVETLLSEMEGSEVDAEVKTPIGSADGGVASPAAEPEAVGCHEKPPGRWGWIPGLRTETPT